MKKIISKRLNLVIKMEVNQRKLLSVLNSFTKISKWLTEQSCRSDPSKANVIPFTNFHTMSTSDWTEAFKWYYKTEILQNSYASSDLSTSLFPETYMVTSLMRRQSDSSVRSPILPSIPWKMSHQ